MNDKTYTVTPADNEIEHDEITFKVIFRRNVVRLWVDGGDNDDWCVRDIIAESGKTWDNDDEIKVTITEKDVKEAQWYFDQLTDLED